MASTIQQKECLKEERLAEAFKAFDKDGSGKISVSEIHAILGITDPAERKKIEEIVGKFDVNKDEELDMEEFISMMVKVDL